MPFAAQLPTLGTMSYGSVTFDALTKSSVRAVPRWDAANRTIICIDYTFEIRANYANDGEPIDSDMETWRQQLLAPGRAFSYVGKGLGEDLSISADGSLSDVSFGPRPLSLNFRPIGNLGAVIDYSIQVSIPECDNGASGNIMALNYSAEYDIDAQGLTTRTISGYLEIAMSVSPGGSLSDNADNYRGRVTPQLLTGFRRESHKFTVSQDKRTLNFSIVDKQLPFPLPPGVSHLECKHKISNMTPMVFANWKGSISATITMPKPANGKGDTWTTFLLLVGTILDKDNLPGMPKVVNLSKGTFFTTTLEIDNDMVGNSCSYSLEFKILGCGLADILKASGLWQPIKGATFDAWKTSMQSITGNRGTAGLQLKTSDDVIVNLCTGANPSIGTSAANLTASAGTGNLNGASDQPAADNTWIQYDNSITLEEDDRVIRHKPLSGSQGVTPNVGPDPTGAVAVVATGAGGQLPGYKSQTPDLVQRISAPTLYVRMQGSATRLKNKTPVPRLIQFGGLNLTLVKQQSAESQVGAIGEANVVFKTWWNLLYLATTPPAAAATVADPELDTGAQSGN